MAADRSDKSHDPAAIYQSRIAAHRSAHARLERLDARCAHARLVVFALVIATAVIVWRAALPRLILLAPMSAFLVLVVRHDRVIRARDAAARAIAYFERGIARIEDRWIGTGETGTRFRDEHHPYADDLDLFGEGSLVFDGVGLGHPLLPAQQMVRNDVRLDAETQLLVVSGSNMPGKSTLLRTVGVNAVLALAGAPVRAVSLRVSVLSIGATLRIQDSLHEGRSRVLRGDHADSCPGRSGRRGDSAALPVR